MNAGEAAVREAGSGPSAGRSLFVALLLLLGLVARLRAAAFPAFELFRSFPSEDGYLMMTVARNLALGKGLTSAAGTMPTNGVQPLATFLQAACFWLVGADRAAGVRILIVFYTAVALATAVLIYRLGLVVLGPPAIARGAAVLAAAAWFAGPLTVANTMNMLETGLYTAIVTSVALCFARGHARAGPWPWSRCLALGGLLGVAFWARNDAVFLMAAVGLAHLASAGGEVTVRRRLAEAAGMAAGAAALSLPWLVHNLLGFGSVMPLSGYTHLRTGHVGANLRSAVVALFEQLTLAVSFEFSSTQGNILFAAGCAAGLAAAGVAGARRVRTWVPGARAMIVAVALFGLGLIGFYVFFYDAPYFVRRYLFPLSPFLALAWGRAVDGLGRGLAASRGRAAAPVLASLLLANFVLGDGLLIRGPWRRGALFRNVDWVEGNVGADRWVGAFQSGTLGFFHDRTINLDGKVNPEALRAIRERRHQAYVVDSPIDYVVDWATILEPWWQSDPGLVRSFQWVVRDREENFAVLGRRGGRP